MIVSVSIPNWNGLDLLRRCLPSLDKQVFKDFEVIEHITDQCKLIEAIKKN